MKDKIADILKSYTSKHGIMASSVILESYADELVKNGCVIETAKTTQGVTYIDIKTHYRELEKLKKEINRQQAEIERLKIVNRVYEDIGKIIQMEAIKEFAETLKFMAKKDGAYDYVSWHQIDSVEKELTGKDEGK